MKSHFAYVATTDSSSQVLFVVPQSIIKYVMQLELLGLTSFLLIC